MNRAMHVNEAWFVLQGRERGQLGLGSAKMVVQQVFVNPGDTVLVPDMGQQRLTRYAPDGAVLPSTPLPLTDGIPVKWMEAPTGGLVQQSTRMQLPGMEDVVPSNHLILRSWSGEVLDTLLELPAGETMSFSDGQPSFRFFEAEPMWTLGPDGRLYTGINSEYSLEEYDPEGQLQRIIRKDFERRPVTESDQEEYRSTMEELETNREELESLNEELQAVSEENRKKAEELEVLAMDLERAIADLAEEAEARSSGNGRASVSLNTRPWASLVKVVVLPRASVMPVRLPRRS